MTTLEVRYRDDRAGQTQYVYTLRVNDGSMTGPLEQECTVDVNQALVKASCMEIDRALENAAENPEHLRATLRTEGRTLYRQLLQPPDGNVLELVRRLQESAEPLMVNSNEDVVPWELLHDGTNFLGLAHDLSRRSRSNFRVLTGRDIGPVHRALVVGDTLGDLAKAREEVDRISAWLGEQGIDCMVLSGAEATLARVIRELTNEDAPYDLFHYSGHVSTVPAATGLLMHRRELIDKQALRTLADRGAPPVVFINGCASAGLTMSVCGEFMLMGAKIVIGTRTIVDDASALRFAEEFYGELRQKVPAGAAVRRARKALAEQPDHSWAAFVLYGDPDARITTDRQPEPEYPGPEPELHLTHDARILMRRVAGMASANGLITSIDLLAGLLETKEIQERSLPRIGARRLVLLREAVEHFQRDDSAELQETVKVNGSAPTLELSDTVSRVLALADEAVAAAGRRTVSVDDIGAALLRVGGSACADLLELCGISMEQLLAPPGAIVRRTAPIAPVAATALSLDGLDPGAASVVQCARLLAAARREPVSSYLMLKAFALTGSAPLRAVLDGFGQEGGKALHRLAALAGPDPAEFTARVLATLEGAAARTTPDSRAGEAELLLAVLSDPGSSARKALQKLGIDPEQVVTALSD